MHDSEYITPPADHHRQFFLLKQEQNCFSGTFLELSHYKYGGENWPRPSIYRPDEVGEPLPAVGVARILPETDLEGVEDLRLSRLFGSRDNVHVPDHK